jgi:RNA polymerase sigma-70 factor, ECF subfamily
MSGFLARLRRFTSDEALVAAMAKGDEQAFTQLVERHAPKVLALAKRLLRSTADAEDITQEVFTRAWQNAAQWRPEAAYATWLHRITLNLSLNHQQRVQRRFESLEDHPQELPCQAPNAEQQLLQAQTGEQLQAALEKLPEAQQIAMQLRYGSEQSVADIAEIMGLSHKAVESLLVRARRGLRQQLATYQESFPCQRLD